MRAMMEARAPEARQDEATGRGDVGRYMATLMGAAPDDLCWDNIHHLQGRAHGAGRPLVVIASRDNSHHTLALTLEEWESIRRADVGDRPSMLRACAIENARLLEALAAC